MRRSISGVEPKTMTVRQAARIAGFGVAAMYRGVEEGVVPHVRIGRRIMVPKAALDRWLEAAGPVEGQ